MIYYSFSFIDHVKDLESKITENYILSYLANNSESLGYVQFLLVGSFIVFSLTKFSNLTTIHVVENQYYNL